MRMTLRMTLRMTMGCLATALGLAPVATMAHGDIFTGDSAHAPIWISQALFVFAWFGYALGAARRRPTFARRLLFHAAMLVAGLALFGPFDDWAASSSAMHMVQHMLLMVVVAPLAVLARPLAQWRGLFGGIGDPAWRALARLSRHPHACALLHAAAIWFWHAPAPYMAALLNNSLHVLEHACFLFTAWLFWWSVLRPGRRAVLPAAMALLFTAMHTGLLGALLTFSSQPLYWPESRELWDQQLAGLVMWIPGGAIYLLAAAWSLHLWLAQRRRADATLPPRARLFNA